MYQRTYLDKCATIVKGSELNTGFNPIGSLLWGRNLSRLLVHFDLDNIQELYNDKTMPDLKKMKHKLHLTNAGGVDLTQMHSACDSQIDGQRSHRASSFDLVFFRIPKLWDGGKGYDATIDIFSSDKYTQAAYGYASLKSVDGASWVQPRNGQKWGYNISYQHTKDNLFDFYLKSNKIYIKESGDDIVFDFYAQCNKIFANADLVFKEIHTIADDCVEISEPIWFSRLGKICATQSQKEKYATHIQAYVKIKQNPSNERRKHNFCLEYTVEGKTFRSNPYTIIQMGKNEILPPMGDDGVFSSDILDVELEKYLVGDDSYVIATQHFNVGCEDIDVDITKYVNDILMGKYENHGIGIAYAPQLEGIETDMENYTGFFTNHTHTFFEPYVETIYEDNIRDDRQKFILDRTNRLYLYSNINGNLENLDKMPVCTIDGKTYPVKMASKGIYYAEVKLSSKDYEYPTVVYDEWSNLVYQGDVLDDVELNFTTNSNKSFFQIGTNLPQQNDFVVSLYGINDNEHIKKGDKRKVNVQIKKNYQKNSYINISGLEARIFIKDGTKEVEVMPYLPLEMTFNENYFIVDTNNFISNHYYVDVKVSYGMEDKVQHEVLHFVITEDENNKYC